MDIDFTKSDTWSPIFRFIQKFPNATNYVTVNKQFIEFK